MAADYHYVSTWQLRAPIERVWTAISDLDHLPAWYPAVHDVQTLAPGDDQGVGARVRYVIKGRLPMRLAFEGTITRVDPPRELDVRAQGELEGTGRWDLDQQDGLTSARYTWDMRTTKPWMNLISPVARPLFTWNSKGVMREAGESLARFLEAPLVKTEFTAPAWPPARPLRWALAAASVLWLVRHTRSSRRRPREVEVATYQSELSALAPSTYFGSSGVVMWFVTIFRTVAI